MHILNSDFPDSLFPWNTLSKWAVMLIFAFWFFVCFCCISIILIFLSACCRRTLYLGGWLFIYIFCILIIFYFPASLLLWKALSGWVAVFIFVFFLYCLFFYFHHSDFSARLLPWKALSGWARRWQKITFQLLQYSPSLDNILQAQTISYNCFNLHTLSQNSISTNKFPSERWLCNGHWAKTCVF